MDVYQMVTDRIVSEMEKGIIPWLKPWVLSGQEMAVSYSTRKPYSLLNQFLLGEPGEYITYNQAEKLGGKVKKGEHGKPVVFWKWLDVEENVDGKKLHKKIPMLKYFTVFHVNQCEGIKPHYEAEKLADHAAEHPDAQIVMDEYLNREGIALHRGDSAYYRPSDDSITIPCMEQFAETSEYYSTAFHEMTHSTGHEKRLNRLTTTVAFGSNTYSKQELVAEIGAAMLNNHCGVEAPESFKNSVAYLQNWLRALKNDKRLIVSAAGKAEKAVKYILNIKEEIEDERA